MKRYWHDYVRQLMFWYMYNGRLNPLERWLAQREIRKRTRQ